MSRRSQRNAAIGCLATVFSLGLAGCSDKPTGANAGSERAATPTPRMPAIRAQFPSARTDGSAGAVVRLYGTSLATGPAPAEAADNFRQAYATAMGLPASDLVASDVAVATGRAGAASSAPGIGLMYDSQTGQPKFWLYRHKQTKDGLPVYRAGLSTLVRNDRDNAVVWAASTVRDLSHFSTTTGLSARAPDLDKSLLAVKGATDFTGKDVAAPTALKNVSQPEVVVFAGTEDAAAEPRMAILYTADAAPVGKWQFVADASTGDVLHVESQVVFANVTGTVKGNVTQGDVAMECAPEVATAFPSAEVDGQTSESTFTDASGAYVLTTSATGSLNITSLMGGQYFDIFNSAGALEQLVSAVVPPGTANFVHNTADTDVLVISQVNGYSNANEVRSFLLKYLPTYPTISTQTNFPVNVNLTSGYCPGNAWYDGSSLNLCQGSPSYTNTSFASVTHHEYGHHIISMGGSGQGEYGEGMADTVATLFAGQHGLGLGFFLNQCTTPLRDADNTCQYSATACSSCGSEIHDCGQLMSGTIWSIRKALAISHPTTYVDLINNLTLSSILVHKGSAINSQIAIDLLTLDDDDGNLNNGTPHYAEICSGFSAHGMACPPILTDLNVSPTTSLAAEGPLGGPFAPASLTYTVTNLGPNTALQYQVAPLAATPWLTISNPTGTLAIGATAQVAVAIDQAAAAGLAKGGYTATVQFTNVTNGVGSTTRGVTLQVGVPQPIYTETFENGLGTFSLGTEPTSLWHVSANCASTQAGHSTPKSLYFGIDSTCTFANGVTDSGTATSVPVSIADTSAVKLRFNYFLATEKLPPYYDQATVQVSINGGAYSILASNGSGGSVLQDSTGAWQAMTIDITALFAGLSSATMRVRVGFNTGDSLYNSYAGFLVDDVQVLAFAGGAANTAPTVNAGADQTITLPAAANLAGTATDDGLPNPPGAMTTTWSTVSGPGTVTFANASALFTTATFSAAGTYVLRLTASDSALSTSDDVQIIVNPVSTNQPPVVNAGPDQTVTLPAVANLTGTATDDGLPNPPGALTTTWSFVSGPGTVTFANVSALATTATFSVLGTYVLRLTASDSVLSASDDIQVVVNAIPPVNQAPVVNAGPDQTITLPAVANLAGTATDDGLPNPPGKLTTTWSQVSGGSQCLIDFPIQLSAKATCSVAGIYVFRLTATDGALTSTDDVTITVNPAPPVNQPPVVNAGPDQTVTLPASANLAGTATDDGLPNPPAKLTTTWSFISGPGTATFANASALSTTATFSAAGPYVLRLTASDSALSTSDDIAITVNAAPVNKAPVVNAGPDQTVTLPAAANLVGTATDDNLPNPPAKVTTTWSKVSGPGTVTFANASALTTTATFSASGAYVLRLTANDSALSATDDIAITVNAAPVNKAPFVNAGPDQSIILPATASLVGTATDDSLPNPPAKVTTTWSKVSGPGTVTFANASALLTTATFSTAGSYTLRLTGNDSALSSADDIIITVNPVGTGPCTGLCTNPVKFTINGSYQSGNLGTGAVCYQTTSTINSGNCGNLASPRALKVNGTTEACTGSNWTSVPAKRNGGYCIQTTAGNYSYAYFTAW
jgi:hypothetical protein